MTTSFPTLTAVELRKMFDTRAGFWLQAIVGLLTAGVVVVFILLTHGETRELRDLFGLAITPAAILLPIVGILLVSSEWSQRTNLITFTLVPQRMRVMNAKLVAGVLVGVVVLALALVVSTLVTAAVGGTWNLSLAVFGQVSVLVTTAMLGGIAFGAAFLSSAPAIVCSFALPLAWTALGSIPALNDAAHWLDTSRTTEHMTERAMSAHEWLQFGTSQLVWLAIPLAIGLVRIARGEIRA
jgi:ABC-2 type transport system permease protein